jgi:hypothetical protein
MTRPYYPGRYPNRLTRWQRFCRALQSLIAARQRRK